MRMFKKISLNWFTKQKIYDAHRADLEKERTEEEFMAMYEQYEAFDDLEEQYMEEEEQITAQIATLCRRTFGQFCSGKQA